MGEPEYQLEIRTRLWALSAAMYWVLGNPEHRSVQAVQSGFMRYSLPLEAK